jgi:hypothetical protein
VLRCSICGKTGVLITSFRPEMGIGTERIDIDGNRRDYKPRSSI